MSVIVKGGGSGQKILLDGVEYNGELKLSTKYQWVLAEPIDFGDISASTRKQIIYHKNEIHVFIKASNNNHFKLVNGQLLPDVSLPFYPSGDYIYNWVCSDDNYIYAIGNITTASSSYKISVFRFDGETWEEIFVMPKKGAGEYMEFLHTPSVFNGKLYLAFKSSSTDYYAGYVDLATLTWVALPTLPSNSMYGYNAFTEIDGVLYSLGSSGTHMFYKLNTNNSWTSLAFPQYPFRADYFHMLTINNKAYIIQPYAFYCFDGSVVKFLSNLEAFEYPSLFFTNKLCLYGLIKQAVDISGNIQIFNVLKTYEKALYLEG